MPYATGTIVEELAALYHARYQTPLLVSETASEGSVARRRAWLSASVDAVRRARASGLPVLGLLKVHGAEATAFLQGQLTNDITGLGYPDKTELFERYWPVAWQAAYAVSGNHAPPTEPPEITWKSSVGMKSRWIISPPGSSTRAAIVGSTLPFTT